jgi:hypothetical protein
MSAAPAQGSTLTRAPTKKPEAKVFTKVCIGIAKDSGGVTYCCGNTGGEWAQVFFALVMLWVFFALWFWAAISVYYKARNIDP